MAFPAVGATATTNGTAATTTPIVNLPTGITAGQTLFVLIRVASGIVGLPPTGWTELFFSSSDGSDDSMSLSWRKADGNEGATAAWTNNASAKFAALSWRITDAADPTVTAPQFATLVTGASTLPNPGALSPTGGAKDYLWLWMGGWEGEQTSPPAGNPTSYTANVIGANSGTAGAVATNCRVASASRQLNAATEDPGSWTISASDDWMATVVAVHPAAPAGALLEGSIGMTAALVGVLTTAITMAGAAAANLAAAAVLTTQITLGGAVAGQMAPAAALTTEIRLAGAVSGQLDPSGDLTAPQQALLEGQLAGTLSGVGNLTTEIRLAGTAAGSAALAGDLLTSISLAGVASGTLQAAGDLTTAIPLAGSVAGQLAGAGALTTEIRLAGSVAGQLVAAGALEDAGGGGEGSQAVLTAARHRRFHNVVLTGRRVN